MDPSSLPLGQIFGGTLTLGGIALIVRLVIHYQRDFADQYRDRLVAQDKRIEHLESTVTALQDDRLQLRSMLVSCTSERAALRALVAHAGLPWDANQWRWQDDYPGSPPVG